MHIESEKGICLTRFTLITHDARREQVLSVRFRRAIQMFCALMGLLALSSTAPAQGVEPALPGSVEYSLISSNFNWTESSALITNGIYVEDLLSDSRSGQPVGRGALGIVTDTAFDPDYNTMAATVNFGRGYSVGIVFPELSAIDVTPVPEPSTLLILLPGLLLWCAMLCRRRHVKATY